MTEVNPFIYWFGYVALWAIAFIVLSYIGCGIVDIICKIKEKLNES